MHPLLHAFLADSADATVLQAQAGGGSGWQSLILFGGMIAIFYFVIWRPQAKERRKVQDFIAALKKGDEVITQGGIVGTVVLVEERTVTIDVGGGTKMRVLKGYIAGPWKQPEPQLKAEAKK